MRHQPRPIRSVIFLACALIALAVAPALDAQPPLPVPKRTISITAAWDASPSDTVTRYRLHHATNSVNWHTNYTVLGRTNTTYTVAGAPAGVSNYFAVTAVTAEGIESDFSNVAIRPVAAPPEPPGPLQAIPVVVTLRWRPPEGQWADLISTTTNYVVVNRADHASGNFSARVDVGDPIPLVATP